MGGGGIALSPSLFTEFVHRETWSGYRFIAILHGKHGSDSKTFFPLSLLTERLAALIPPLSPLAGLCPAIVQCTG